jgi:hypothetical protein
VDATRRRFGSAIEWLIAAAFLAATLAVGTLVLQQIRSVYSTSSPVSEPQAPAVVPAAAPSGGISVPFLLLADGKEVRVGDTLESVAALLGRSAEVGTQDVTRGALGDRLSRHYDYAGSRFVLVFEPFERNGTPRVAAIFIK